MAFIIWRSIIVIVKFWNTISSNAENVDIIMSEITSANSWYSSKPLDVCLGWGWASSKRDRNSERRTVEVRTLNSQSFSDIFTLTISTQGLLPEINFMIDTDATSNFIKIRSLHPETPILREDMLFRFLSIESNLEIGTKNRNLTRAISQYYAASLNQELPWQPE